MSPVDVVVARQAIFDRDLGIYGYELLYRTVDGGNTAGVTVDSDRMTSAVLFNSVSIGIERLVGNGMVFINASRGLLTGSIPMTLPPERTVVEILESVSPDDEVIAGCRRLKTAGFTLALDDFTWFDGAERLLELASIVKLDLRLTPLADVPALAERCRAFDVALLAEKIETPTELQKCLELGFDYYQGYALGRPALVPSRTLDSSSMGRLRIAASLVGEDFNVDRLASIIRTEPAISYQLLQLAGLGARNGTRRKVRTLREAIVLVGTRRIQNWIALLMLTSTGAPSTEDVTISLTRARMSEILARPLGKREAEIAFTAGMLSAFDLLLGLPIEALLPGLSLDAELLDAAFGYTTAIGRIVRDVVDHQNARTGVRLSGHPEVDLDLASIQALTWALEAVGELKIGETSPSVR
jgi:c-di-GMP-related signal transduction protein